MKKLLLLLALFSANVLATPVNINKADAKTIADSLIGIGMKKADAIVADRTKNGAFKTIDDLDRVPGIGKKTIEENRANILLTDTPTAPAKSAATPTAAPASAPVPAKK